MSPLGCIDESSSVPHRPLGSSDRESCDIRGTLYGGGVCHSLVQRYKPFLGLLVLTVVVVVVVAVAAAVAAAAVVVVASGAVAFFRPTAC